MAISVDCPGGHVLRLKDEYAGQTGYCPRCKTKVTVPASYPISDDEILGILVAPSGVRPEPLDDSDSVLDHPPPSAGDSELSLLGSSKIRGRKMCTQCGHLSSFSFSVCPKCAIPLPDRPAAEPAPADVQASAGPSRRG